jgi:hypothetical protein
MLTHTGNGGKGKANTGSDIGISTRPGGEITPPQIVRQRLFDSLKFTAEGVRTLDTGSTCAIKKRSSVLI